MLELLRILIGRSDGLADVVTLGALVAARVAPLTFLAPWIALRSTPAALRTALLVALTVALTPVALGAPHTLPADALAFAVAVTREALLGTAFAIATAVPLHALDMAGRIIDGQRGASNSDVSTPSGERSSPLGSLQLALGAVLFLALGGHRLVIEALADGLVALPPGAPLSSADLASFGMGVARIVIASLTLALSFAAPAMVSLLISEVALGLTARAAPQIPIHFAGMPLRAAVGVAALLLSVSVLLPHLPRIMRDAVDEASHLVISLGG